MNELALLSRARLVWTLKSRKPGTAPAHSSRVLPVICGFDIADYAFARIFHESMGLRSLVVTDVSRGPINDSSIFDVELAPKGTLGHEREFITHLHRVASEHPDEQLILCVNSDEGVEYVAKHRVELQERWFLPYASLESVQKANSKEAMAEIFASCGLSVPARTVVDLTRPDSWERSLSAVTFPIVVKPEDGADRNFYWRKGLRKAMPVQTLEEAIEAFTGWHANGVDINLIVQDLIPGDDTTQWVVNGYVDSKGRVTATGSGRVLLGLHEPDTIGNAAMILVQPHEEFMAAAQRAVLAAGLRGFFSMDVKIDPRDGKEYWLDLNARIGRSHYYLKVGGIDLVQSLIADMQGRDAKLQSVTKEGIYTVVPMFLASRRYILDRELLRRVRRLRRAKGAQHPLKYRADRSFKRFTYRILNQVNQLKLMRTYYPRPTESGF